MTPGLPWISVLTTPRRPDYLRGTLAAIDDAGGAAFAGRKIVFVDDDATERVRPLVGPGWDVERLSPQSSPGVLRATLRGTLRSMWEILHRAALARAGFLLYFEDDVRLSLNAITAMSSFSVPDELEALSFFQMNPGMSTEPGTHRFRLPRFWGAQCLKIPDRSLARFAGDDDETLPTYPFACDVWIGERLSIGIVLPAIVRHIGALTSIPRQLGQTLVGDWAYRAGLAYAGDGADAFEVLGPASAVVYDTGPPPPDENLSYGAQLAIAQLHDEKKRR